MNEKTEVSTEALRKVLNAINSLRYVDQKKLTSDQRNALHDGMEGAQAIQSDILTLPAEVRPKLRGGFGRAAIRCGYCGQLHHRNNAYCSASCEEYAR